VIYYNQKERGTQDENLKELNKMTKIEMIVKVLEARIKAYKTDLDYTESVYGKDSLQASRSAELLCSM
jgi:hypothetical protein